MEYLIPVLMVILVVLLIMVWVRLTLLPIQVAKHRNHPQYDAIFVTSLLSIAIPPLWILAIIWAYTAPAPAPAQPPKADIKDKIAAARAKWEAEQAARQSEG